MTRDRDDPFDRMFEEMFEQVREMMEQMSNMDVEDMSKMDPEDFEDFEGDINGFTFTNMRDMGENPGFGGFGPFGPEAGEGPSAGPNFNPGAGPARDPASGGSTHVDLLDEGDVVRVVADVPGVEKDDIEVSVSGDELRIHASREGREYDERVALPPKVDETTGDATYNNGVLEISFEKHDTDDEHEIDIE